ELCLEASHQSIKLLADRPDRGWLTQVHAGALEQRHRVVRSTGSQQVEITVDGGGANLRAAVRHFLHQPGSGGKAGRVLIDVVRRLEEMRNANPRVLGTRILR